MRGKRNLVTILLMAALALVVVVSTVVAVAAPKYAPTQGPGECLPWPEVEGQFGQFSINRAGTRHCFDSDSTAYIVVKCPWILDTYDVRVYKEVSEGTFELQDFEDAPSSQVIYDVDSRFDGTLIHVVYYDDDGSDNNINYATFDTSTDQWGSSEIVTTLDKLPSVPYRRSSISLDSSDKPHILYTSGKKIRGTTYAHLKYKNKVGASWSTEEAVHPTNERRHRIDMTVGHESDNRFVVVWENVTDANVGVRTRSSSGVWDTEGVVKAASVSPSLMIDPGDKKQVALTSGGNLYCVEGTPGASPSWSASDILEATARDPSITRDGNCLYVLYEETTNHDIMLVVKDSTWSDPILLQEASQFPVYYHVVVQGPASSDNLDYVWSDTAGYMYWEEYSL